MTSPFGPRSLARELLALIVGAVALIWLAAAGVSYVDARHELDELLDAHLTQVASLLLAQASDRSESVDADHAPQLHRYSRRVAFQLWERGTTLRLHSLNAPDVRLAQRDEGFANVNIAGRRWRVFSAWDPDRRYLVQVAESLEGRDETVAKIARGVLLPLALALPVLALLIWMAIRRSMKPLRVLNRQIEARAPDNLGTVEIGKAPAEVLPLIGSLNRLFGRVAASIDSERRFTADAAHELRTPLAALRAQAQVALGCTDDAERRRALDNVIAGCDRATHLVTQLLTLARLEPQDMRIAHAPCELRSILRQNLAELAPAALERNVEVELADGPATTVVGDARLLDVLFRNLTDNAVRYSPANSRVTIRVGSADREACVVIADEGPGIPAAQRASIGRRFQRLAGNDAAGTGLGLSIALRIAELHGATIAFDDNPQGHGLMTTVTFPSSK